MLTFQQLWFTLVIDLVHWSKSVDHSDTMEQPQKPKDHIQLNICFLKCLILEALGISDFRIFFMYKIRYLGEETQV